MVPAELYPWRAVGRVNLGGHGFCTGTLVAQDVVLTAAHCLRRPEGGWYALSDIHFVAAYERGRYRVHLKVREALLPSAAEAIGGTEPEALVRDWAILRLDGKVAEGWLALRSFDQALLEALATGRAELLQAGYRRDRAHGISLSRDCRILGSFGSGAAGLLQSCHVVKGASGSPLIALEGGRFSLVGVNVARVQGLGGQAGKEARGAEATASVSTRIFSTSGAQPDARRAAERAGLALP